MNDKYRAEYIKTTIEGVWQVLFINDESIMFDHIGYVYSDEAGMFSLKIYGTPNEAESALLKHNKYLNTQRPEESTF